MTLKAIRLQRRGKAGPSAPGTVDLYFDATIRSWRYVDEGGNTYALASGGGGVTSHPALTGLAWTSSGHTGSAGALAGFNGSGEAGNVSAGTGLSLAAGTLAVDTATIATQAWVGAGYQPLDSDLTAIAALGNGLPYRSGGVWSALSLASPLTASGGTLTVAQAGASTPGTVTLDQLDGGVAGVTATTDTGAGLLGTVDLDGTNTYSFLTLSGGNTYTVNATQVATFVNCTIRTGITLRLAGSPLRVVDLLKTEGTAAIRNDGANGTAGPGGAGASGGAPAAINSRTTANVYIGGYSGAPGHTLNSNGDNAQALSNSVWVGGAGGAGGSGVYLTTTRTGGAGGSGLTTQQWAPHFHGEFTQILLQGAVLGSAGRLQIAGGTGGGSGGAAIGSGGQGSAPGGGGGGIVVVCAGSGDFSSSTVISAAGGNAGTTATGGGTGNGGSGGSAGGGGGALLFKIGRVLSASLPSFDVSGGDGANGAQIGGGRGDGGNGGAGGRAVVIVGGYAGSAPTIDVSGGAAGNGNGSGAVAGTAGAAGSSTYVAL